MIRPVSDYRIGNLVLDEDGELCMIEQLSSSKIGCFQQVSNIENKSCISKKYPSNIYAIKLTEEWLIKFGFRKYNLEGYSVHFRYEHPKLHSTVTAIYNSDFSIKLDDVARGIKYVHQLQNIYFALTNKELELIKE